MPNPNGILRPHFELVGTWRRVRQLVSGCIFQAGTRSKVLSVAEEQSTVRMSVVNW